MPTVVLFKSESSGPDKFTTALEIAGFAVQSINCLEFRFKNLQLLEEKLQQPEKYEGIIFTSQRAVEGTSQAISNEPKAISKWIEKMNFCVGQATSELCKSLLHLEPRGSESGNAQNLAAIIIESYANTPCQKPFLFPSGNLKQDILEKSLSEHQIEVETIELYETVVHSKLDESLEQLNVSEINYLVFFSPSGVKFLHRFLLENQESSRNCQVIAIGPSTRKALEDSNIVCHFTCSKPTPESLIEVLQTPRE